MKRTQRANGKIIRQNRPGYRKKVLGRKGQIKFRHRGTKIKSKKYIEVKK